jgi:DNA replication protein DnaC
VSNVDFRAKLREMNAAHGEPMLTGPQVFAPDERKLRLERAGLGLPGDIEDDILRGRPLIASLALTETKAFMDGSDSYLLLSGPTGRGKTVSCAWVLANHGGYCVSGPKLTRLQASAGYDRDSRAQLDNLHMARTVVLDELARDDELQKHEKTGVFELINARQERGKRTLITTNRAPLYLYKRYEDFVFKRLRAEGKTVLLEGEPDYRELRIRARDG